MVLSGPLATAAPFGTYINDIGATCIFLIIFFFNELTLGPLYELLTAVTWLTANDSESALYVERHSNVAFMDVTPESARFPNSIVVLTFQCARESARVYNCHVVGCAPKIAFHESAKRDREVNSPSPCLLIAISLSPSHRNL